MMIANDITRGTDTQLEQAAGGRRDVTVLSAAITYDAGEAQSQVKRA